MFLSRIKTFISPAVFISSVCILSCTNHSIDIGVASTLSGKNSDLGIHCKNGIILATEEINQSGVLGKRKIKLFISDDKNSPEEAAAINSDFIGKGIHHFNREVQLIKKIKV